MSETPGQIEPQRTIPVKEISHQVDDWTNLFYLAGQATSRSAMGRSQEDPIGTERSLLNRVARAGVFKNLQAGNITREEAVQKGAELDEIDKQFLSQTELTVPLPGLGEQKAFFTTISPEVKEGEKKPPLFIVPALSGDLYGIESIMREAALQGRQVSAIAYPESQGGFATKEFEEANHGSQSYQPHTAFFKEAINKIVGEDGNVELWGYSTGGPIVAELLSDPEVSSRVTDAVIITPASTVPQTKFSFNKGLLHEGLHLGKALLRPGNLNPNTGFVYGSKTPVDSEMKGRRKRIYEDLLYGKVINESKAWGTAKVKDGGSILVVVAGEDEITKSYSKASALTEQNPQIDVISYPGWSHLGPLLNAQELVGNVTRVQEGLKAQ